ncbi:MAG: oligosaccharide flippase family protein [bacterium]
MKLLTHPRLLSASLRRADKTLVRGAMWAFGLNGAGLALGFVTQAILARTLGSKGFGLYLYVLGWSNVAGLLCALEFSHAAVRYVSSYSATHDWASMRGFLRRSHQIVGAITGLVGLIAAIVLVSTKLERETQFCFLVASGLFPLTSLIQLQGGCLLGLKRVRQSQAPFQVVRPALFAIGLLSLAYVLGRSFDAADAIAIQFFATGLALSITAWFLRSAVPRAAMSVAPVYHTMEWVRASSHFVAISIAQLVLSTQADLLFVGALVGTVATGLYGAASQFATLVAVGSTAIMVIAQPMIADLYARNRIPELARLSRQIMLLTILASMPVFVGVVVFGRQLLHLYGAQFEPAYPVLVVLATSQLVAAVVGMLLGYLFTMTAHQQMATKIIGASAALNIVLTLILTPWLGMIGTATATATATLVRSIALAVAGRKILKEYPAARAAS